MKDRQSIVIARIQLRMLVISDEYKPPEVVVDQLIRLQCDVAVLLAMASSNGVFPAGQEDVVDP